MDRLLFWKQKLVQFLHDPPHKAYTGFKDFSQESQSRKIFAAVTGENLKYYGKRPDWAMTGADRALVSTPRQKGVSPVQVAFPSDPEVTHPLHPGFRLWVGHPDPAVRRRVLTENFADEIERLVTQDRNEEAPDPLADWTNPDSLERAFFWLWRRLRDELAATTTSPQGSLVWPLMPADSRQPDHTIWDHTRMTSAVAFMIDHRVDPTSEGSRRPWFLRFSVGRPGTFLSEARTSRDLWMSSMLLMDLTWHAMLPVIELYGPDAIIYPDLRANPRADIWLFDRRPDSRDVLPSDLSNPSTHAAVLPNVFTAIVPEGTPEAGSMLLPIPELTRKCGEAVAKRWADLAKRVRSWMEMTTKSRDWFELFDNQQAEAIETRWTALPWLPMAKYEDVPSSAGPGLPFQRPDHDPVPEAAGIDPRRAQLQPFVPMSVWSRYEQARRVAARSNPFLHHIERGFDYALTHHQLLARHALQNDSLPPGYRVVEAKGEKCTLCGRREALGPADNSRSFDQRVQQVREFWRRPELDPEEAGADRLCGVCAVKRFLVQADGAGPGPMIFNAIWAGPAATDGVSDQDGQVRFPFPSTSAIAAQGFLERVATHPGLEESMRGVVEAHRSLGWPRTNFPRSLPRLAMLGSGSSIAAGFLKIDPQESVFPESLEGRLRLADLKSSAGASLLRAVRTLRRNAKRLECGAPATDVAVIRLDGDSMGRLLLGSDDVMKATWRHVLHPSVVEQVEKNQHLQDAGWSDHLNAPRLVGPSLHALISRTLATFSHVVVPWVIEREYSGRLIYAGGDDVLALAPAPDALGIVSRLQQLFSAAWVIDNLPREVPWRWRARDWTGGKLGIGARDRFLVPRPPKDGSALRLPVEGHSCEPFPGDPISPSVSTSDGARVFSMLGASGSLSAAISIAHYKTPLSLLLRNTKEMLLHAKALPGKAGLVIGHRSRGGAKSTVRLKVADVSLLRRVIAAFRDGALPGRLPYKLRGLIVGVEGALGNLANLEAPTSEDLRGRLLEGLVRSSVGKVKSIAAVRDATALWEIGLGERITSLTPDTGVEDSLQGRLLCRQLASLGELS